MEDVLANSEPKGSGGMRGPNFGKRLGEFRTHGHGPWPPRPRLRPMGPEPGPWAPGPKPGAWAPGPGPRLPRH